MITLTPYQNAHHPALTAYRLNPEQAQFTAQPHERLNDPIPAHAHPITILHHNTPVGFFILDAGPDKTDYSDHPHALLLRSMSINPAYQGQGIAKAALAALPDYIRSHHPEHPLIVLGVNTRNHPAHQLYLRSGFRDTGRTYPGIKGLQYILELTL